MERSTTCLRGVESLEPRLTLDSAAGSQPFTSFAGVRPLGVPLASMTTFTINTLVGLKAGSSDYFQNFASFRNFGSVTFNPASPSGLSFSDAAGVWGAFQSNSVVEDPPPSPNTRQFYVGGQYTNGTTSVAAGNTLPKPVSASMTLVFTQGVGGVTFQGTFTFPAIRPPVEPAAVIASADIGCNSEPRVYVIDPVTGTVSNSFLAYEPGFRGGVRVAYGDVDGNPATREIITAPGPGRAGEVRVFKADGTELTSFRYTPFGAAYKGGVELAVGQLNPSTARSELVVAASVGPGFVQTATSNGTAFATQKSFTAFAAPYKNGATVAVGGANKVLVANGVSKQPTVKTFDVAGTPRLESTFFPTSPKGTGGVSITTQNYVAGSIQTIVAGGAGANSATGVYRNGANPPVYIYNPYSTSARPNAATFAAAARLNSNVTDAVFMTQGPGGVGPLVRVNPTTGAIEPGFKPTFRGVRLGGPMRVATAGPTVS